MDNTELMYNIILKKNVFMITLRIDFTKCRLSIYFTILQA